MIIRRQARFLQLFRLLFRQHAEGAAHFHAQRGHTAHHLENILKFPALRRLPPCRSHAESRHSAARRFPRHLDHVLGVQQALAPDAGIIPRALRAIRAVLRTAACLDRNQLAGLHAVGSMELAMARLRPENKLRQRRAVDGFDFCPLPIVSQIALGRIARRAF